jgi:DNA modification methylase
MVEVFREVRRVLKADGTLWLNLGDSYASDVKGSGGPDTSSTLVGTKAEHNGQRMIPQKVQHGLKPKDLVGIPWRVAFALQADGWYLRSDIIWSKPNPMPESVTDRPTKAHEYLFLLAKSERYYYDAEAIREYGPTYIRKAGGYIGFGETHTGNNQRGGLADKDTITTGRNKRSVWEITTQPYPEAHFATFPPKLVEPCVMAGCPVGGLVLDPFAGSGTVLAVAKHLNRQAVGIELNQDYIALAERRLIQEVLPF